MTNGRKTRVALCITELEIGGAEKTLTELACGLDRDRFEPVVYSLRSRAFHDGALSFIPILERHGVPVRFLNVDGPFSFAVGIGRLRKMLRQQGADVFQSFLFHANFLGRFAARSARVPVVCSGIRVSEKEKRWHLLLDRITARQVDCHICVSRSVAEFTEKMGGIPAERIVVIPNAVAHETSVAASLVREEPARPPLFAGIDGKKAVFVGRLTPQKGVDWLLETAPFWLGDSEYGGGNIPAQDVRKNAPIGGASDDATGGTNGGGSDGVSGGGSDWSLWLIGTGPEEAALKERAKKLPAPVAARIHFVGWRPDIAAILSEADLFLLPSRWEGMPNVLLESMIAGLAILSTRSDGVVELLGDEAARDETCAFGATDEFLARIGPLLTDPALRQRLGAANKKRAEADFSVETMVRRYEQRWTYLLENRF